LVMVFICARRLGFGGRLCHFAIAVLAGK
jgi:hypothetical protein